jgi:CubicO group peptidase (beta-lactamase class C family)
VDSRVLVASISKIFIALSVATSFQDRGILPSDSLYAIELGPSLNFSPLGSIRIDHLLSHQSGIRDNTFSEKILSFSKSQNLNEWGLEFVANLATYHSDSSYYNYADSNYDLLGFLLTANDATDLDSFVKTHVFEPSGMTNSEFVSEWPMKEKGLTGYQKTFIWKRIEPKRISFPVLPSPSSGLVTTTKDMSMAMVQLLRGENGAYQKAIDWLIIEDDDVPLGFQKTQINGSEWIGHFGGQAGYSSLLFYSKETKTAIFLFANSRDKSDFRIQIANQVISYLSP